LGLFWVVPPAGGGFGQPICCDHN